MSPIRTGATQSPNQPSFDRELFATLSEIFADSTYWHNGRAGSVATKVLYKALRDRLGNTETLRGKDQANANVILKATLQRLNSNGHILLEEVTSVVLSAGPTS